MIFFKRRKFSIILKVGRYNVLRFISNLVGNFKSLKSGSQVAHIARRCHPTSRKSRIVPNLMENQRFW